MKTQQYYIERQITAYKKTDVITQLQKEIQLCEDWFKLLRGLTTTKNENLPLLTLSPAMRMMDFFLKLKKRKPK